MTRQQKQAFWFEHIRAWRSSGLTQADYCAFRDLSRASFAYWLRQQSESEVGQPRAVDLVPVRLVPEPSTKHDPLVVRGAGGWALEIPHVVSASWVAQLLGALA